MLARKVVTRRGRRFRGYFPSHKLSRMVAWESLLERDAIQLLEFSPGVVSYQEQPTLIHYFDGHQMRDYYPDFELLLRGGAWVHLEVKTSSQLAKPKVASKLRAIATNYIQRKQKFRIVTEQEIRREPLLTNARTLSYLLGRSGYSLPTAAALIQILGQNPLPFSMAEAKLGRETTLRLIATGALECDLTQPLTADTPVVVAQGGRHATILL